MVTGHKLRELLHLVIVSFALGLGLILILREPSIGHGTKKTPPGSIRLLPGYSHQREMGIDSLAGRISKPGGPTIRYDMRKYGTTGAHDLIQSGKAIWSKSQVIDGTSVTMAMRDDQTLVLTVGKTSDSNESESFVVESVRTPEDVADVLLMLLSAQQIGALSRSDSPSPPPRADPGADGESRTPGSLP
jgi:hypothetical protein